MPTKKLELGGGLVLAAVLLFWPLFTNETAHFYGSLSAIYALVGLSLVILIGWTGQISLGHAAFLGFGCYFGSKLLNNSVPLELAVPVMGVIGAAISLVLGIPSLRLRGVYLTITTLAFGLACQRYFFTRPSVRSSNADEVPRKSLAGISTNTDKGLYYAVLLVLVIALLLAYNVRRTDVGRVLFAIRDSEPAAQAMAIKIAPYKVGVFAASAALATIAGLFYGMLFRATPGPDQFGVLQSLFYLAMPVLGGAEALLGALIGGSFLATGQPLVNQFDIRLFLATAVVLLLMLLSGYDGVIGMMHAARKALADAVRGEPVRYGSFLPESEVTDTRAAPVVHVATSAPPPPGSIVRARLVRGGTA
ncbi:MAG TPA: branched-chain amino acid ABC transporter permease [Sporichthya sp.]|nr:branched-chain amino acid ABC transporter permease [Sporichthya sp.]